MRATLPLLVMALVVAACRSSADDSAPIGPSLRPDNVAWDGQRYVATDGSDDQVLLVSDDGASWEVLPRSAWPPVATTLGRCPADLTCVLDHPELEPTAVPPVPLLVPQVVTRPVASMGERVIVARSVRYLPEGPDGSLAPDLAALAGTLGPCAGEQTRLGRFAYTFDTAGRLELFCPDGSIIIIDLADHLTPRQLALIRDTGYVDHWLVGPGGEWEPLVIPGRAAPGERDDEPPEPPPISTGARLWVGTPDGIRASVDGLTWEVVAGPWTSGPAVLPVVASVDGAIAVAQCDGGSIEPCRLWLSLDDGQTWAQPVMAHPGSVLAVGQAGLVVRASPLARGLGDEDSAGRHGTVTLVGPDGSVVGRPVALAGDVRVTAAVGHGGALVLSMPAEGGPSPVVQVIGAP